MKQWLNLFEKLEVYSPEEDDPGEIADAERNAAIELFEKKVRLYCEQFGFEFGGRSYQITYVADEHQLSITPDQEDATLEQLTKLAVFGSVSVDASTAYQLNITIKLRPDLKV
jgi:hypothetical protein